MRTATITVPTPDAEMVGAALAPEGTRGDSRARVSIHADANRLRLEVIAPDTSALRAVLNAYLRWTATALQLIEEARS